MQRAPSFDYYETLSVTRNATDSEIKIAFRRLAVLHHPDKHLDKKAEAEEKFKQLNEAYQVLSDSLKRKDYDNFIFSNHKNTTYRTTFHPTNTGSYAQSGSYTPPKQTIVYGNASINIKLSDIKANAIFTGYYQRNPKYKLQFHLGQFSPNGGNYTYNQNGMSLNIRVHVIDDTPRFKKFIRWFKFVP